MRSIPFGRTQRSVGEIGFGAWAIGGAWGSFDDEAAIAALNAALDAGVDLLHAADVYDDGHSQRLIACTRTEGARAHAAVRISIRGSASKGNALAL